MNLRALIVRVADHVYTLKCIDCIYIMMIDALLCRGVEPRHTVVRVCVCVCCRHTASLAQK